MAWRTAAKWTAVSLGACLLILLVFGSTIFEQFIERGVAPYLGDKPAYTHEAGQNLDFRVKMKDGVELATEVFFARRRGALADCRRS